MTTTTHALLLLSKTSRADKLVVAAPREVRFLSATNVLRRHDGVATHWVALAFAVLDPGKVAIGEPSKVDALGWFTTDALPRPRHSQLDAQLEVCRRAAVI